MKKMVWIVCLACVIGLTACGAKQEKKETKKDYIIGLDDTFAPMGFRNEKNELVGFDVELAREIATINGWNLVFQPIDWSIKEQELQTGKIDMIWNGYTVTPKRQEKVGFSDTYLENRQIVIVLSDSQVQTLADLKGKTVALQAESSAIDAVKKRTDFAESLKEMPEYATNIEVFKDLEIGRADAIVVDEVLARYYMRSNGQEAYRVLEEDLGKEEFAVGIRKDDTELKEALNAGLKKLKEDGKYEDIYKKWFSEN